MRALVFMDPEIDSVGKTGNTIYLLALKDITGICYPHGPADPVGARASSNLIKASIADKHSGPTPFKDKRSGPKPLSNEQSPLRSPRALAQNGCERHSEAFRG